MPSRTGLLRRLATLETACVGASRRDGRIDWSRVTDAELDRLDRLAPSPGLERIVVIVPASWSLEAHDAYDTACWAGDNARQAAIIAEETGELLNLRDGSVIADIVEVGGGPSPSPSSGTWSRRSINRINSDAETWDYWTGGIESDKVTRYNSDGNPETVTIPHTLDEDIAGHWDSEWASAYGMEIIRYDAAP